MEILEYFKSISERYFKRPVRDPTTFSSNMGNIEVCRWIIKNCGISPDLFHMDSILKEAIESGDVEFVKFLLHEVNVFGKTITFKYFNVTTIYDSGHKD